VAGMLLFWTSLAYGGASQGVNCTPTRWPPMAAPNVLQSVLAAERDAVAGDAAGQWLLGSLYLYGLGVPKDFAAGTRWIQTAAGTAARVLRNPRASDNLSDAELFATMLNAAEALPYLVQESGATRGIAIFGQEARGLIQALAGCFDQR
jgi:TPR repeat protein